MFTTLQFTPKQSNGNNEAALVERTSASPRALGHYHLACLNCRSKKLRCTGQKSGCNRCLTKGLQCTYQPVTKNQSARHSQKSGEKGRSTHSPTKKADRQVAADQVKNSDVPITTAQEESRTETEQGFTDSSGDGASNEGQTDMMSLDSPVDISSYSDDSLFDFNAKTEFNTSDMFSSMFNDSLMQDLYCPPTQKNSLYNTMTEFPTSHQLSGQDLDVALKFSNIKGAQSRNQYEDHFDTLDGFCLRTTKNHNGSPNNGHIACSCQQQAILILEELEVKRRQKTAIQFADLMLVARRRSLAHCETMLACNRCTLASSSVMLVILICEKIIATLQIKAFDEDKGSGGGGGGGGGGAKNFEACMDSGAAANQLRFDRHITLGEYQIKTEQEWGRVVELLTSLQLRRLKGLLALLRSVVESGGWNSLLDILQSHEVAMAEIMKNSV